MNVVDDARTTLVFGAGADGLVSGSALAIERLGALLTELSQLRVAYVRYLSSRSNDPGDMMDEIRRILVDSTSSNRSAVL